jgi:hypothetical protein
MRGKTRNATQAELQKHRKTLGQHSLGQLISAQDGDAESPCPASLYLRNPNPIRVQTAVKTHLLSHTAKLTAPHHLLVFHPIDTITSPVRPYLCLLISLDTDLYPRPGGNSRKEMRCVSACSKDGCCVFAVCWYNRTAYTCKSLDNTLYIYALRRTCPFVFQRRSYWDARKVICGRYCSCSLGSDSCFLSPSCHMAKEVKH